MITGPLPILKPLWIPSTFLGPSGLAFSNAWLESPFRRYRTEVIDVTEDHLFDCVASISILTITTVEKAHFTSIYDFLVLKVIVTEFFIFQSLRTCIERAWSLLFGDISIGLSVSFIVCGLLRLFL